MYIRQFPMPLNLPGWVIIIVRAFVKGEVVQVMAKPVQKAVPNTKPVLAQNEGS